MSADRYHLRPARFDDVEAIRAVEIGAAGRFRDTAFAWIADVEPVGVAAILSMIETGQILVVEHAGTAIAFAEFSSVDGACYIDEVDVLPAHAGHRLAARLIDAIEIWARGRSLPALTLSTFRHIPWNAPYYRRLGFTDLDNLTPGLAAIRDRHRGLGLADADRVFMYRPVA